MTWLKPSASAVTAKSRTAAGSPLISVWGKTMPMCRGGMASGPELRRGAELGASRRGLVAVLVREAVAVGELGRVEHTPRERHDVRVAGERDDAAADEARRLGGADIEPGHVPGGDLRALRADQAQPERDERDPVRAELVRHVEGHPVDRDLAPAVGG